MAKKKTKKTGAHSIKKVRMPKRKPLSAPKQAPQVKDLKKNLEKAIKTDRKAVEESISQVKEIAQYLRKNWKKVLPSIAALGASTYFMKKRTSKKTKTK